MHDTDKNIASERSRQKGRLGLVPVLLLLLFVAAPAVWSQSSAIDGGQAESGPPSYRIEIIATEGADLFPLAINGNGWITGRYRPAGAEMGMFLWDGRSLQVDRETARPIALTSSGQVLGWKGSVTAPQPMFRDAAGNESSFAFAYGRVVAAIPGGQLAAIRGLPGTEEVVLVDGPQSYALAGARSCRLAGMAEDGSLAFSLRDDGGWRSYVQAPFGERIEIGDLGGGDSLVKAMSADGMVVGVSRLTNGSHHAFRWRDGRMRDLGTLGGRYSQALAVNSRGQVLGWSQDAEGHRHSVLWENGRIYDLAPWLGAGSVIVGLNDRGQLTGWRPDGHGGWQALIATPRDG